MLVALALLFTTQGSGYPAYAVPRLEGVTIKGLPPVTGRICVDQFGYLPESAKVAVISDPRKGYNSGDHYTPGKSFELRRRSDGKVPLQFGRRERFTRIRETEVGGSTFLNLATRENITFSIHQPGCGRRCLRLGTRFIIRF